MTLKCFHILLFVRDYICVYYLMYICTYILHTVCIFLSINYIYCCKKIFAIDKGIILHWFQSLIAGRYGLTTLFLLAEAYVSIYLNQYGLKQTRGFENPSVSFSPFSYFLQQRDIFYKDFISPQCSNHLRTSILSMNLGGDYLTFPGETWKKKCVFIMERAQRTTKKGFYPNWDQWTTEFIWVFIGILVRSYTTDYRRHVGSFSSTWQER